MDKKTLLKLINNNIQEIEILIDSFSESYGIPDIEINLIHSKIKVLKDEFEILSGLKNVEPISVPVQKEQEKPKAIEEKKVEKDIINVEKQPVIDAEEEEKMLIKEKTTPQKPQRRKIQKSQFKTRKGKKIITTRADLEKLSPPNEDIEEVIALKKKPEIKPDTTVKKKTKDKNSIMADKFVVTKQSINDLIATSKKTRDLATKLKDMPIENLKKAINLNDKIRFIKELFNGQSDIYQKAIDELNNCNNLDEALKYLNENFAWDQDKESFRDFLELVYRRFINI